MSGSFDELPEELRHSQPLELAKEFYERFQADSYNRVVTNAVTYNSLSDVTRNHQCYGRAIDCTHEVSCTGSVKDQARAGLCWIYAGLGVLRQKMNKHYGFSDFSPSVNFVHFWDKFEKAKTSLAYFYQTYRRTGDCSYAAALNYCGDGGHLEYLQNIIERYGICPEEHYPPTRHTVNSAELRDLVKSVLTKTMSEMKEHIDAEMGPAWIREADVFLEKPEGFAETAKLSANMELLGSAGNPREEDLKASAPYDFAGACYRVYCVLAYCLGAPPCSFEWRYHEEGAPKSIKNLTPLRFYRSLVPLSFGDYATSVCHDPRLPYGQVYRLPEEWSNVIGRDHFVLNLPIDRLKELAADMVANDEVVYVALDYNAKACDVICGEFSETVNQLGELLRMDLQTTKEDRLNLNAGHANHAMTIVGMHTEDRTWKLENSWSRRAGKAGYFLMTDEYFNQHVYIIGCLSRLLTEGERLLWERRSELAVPISH